MEPIGTIDPSKLPPKEKAETGETPTTTTTATATSTSSKEPVPLSATPTIPAGSKDPLQPTAEKRTEECTGGRFDNLYLLLTNRSCEVDARGDPPLNVKDALEVKVTSSTPQIVPGGRVDLLITYRNKSSRPLPLTFVLDPSPRFDAEAYNAQGRLSGIPATKPPQPKKPKAPPPKTYARMVLSPGGIAKMKTGWTASNFRWATELVKNGEIPDSGYPKVATTPIAKGQYTLRLVTPLVFVIESADRELSSPKIPVEVAE